MLFLGEIKPLVPSAFCKKPGEAELANTKPPNCSHTFCRVHKSAGLSSPAGGPGTVLPSLLVCDRCQTGSYVHKGLTIQHKKVRRGLGKKRHSINELCRIFYVNINGYRSKAGILKQIIEEVKPAIILLCENI